jgi:hypothetical protein
MRLLIRIWTQMRDGWRWFRQADPDEKKEAFFRYWPG